LLGHSGLLAVRVLLLGHSGLLAVWVLLCRGLRLSRTLRLTRRLCAAGTLLLGDDGSGVAKHRLGRLSPSTRRARLHRWHRSAARTARLGVHQHRRAAVRAWPGWCSHSGPLSFQPERYLTTSSLCNRVACYVSYMARRLQGHDAVRGEAIEVRIADASVRAFPDESIAAAAIASGTRVLARSLKYHRPRTFFCFEGHCSGCLVRLSGVPNLRACQAACSAGAEGDGQNAFPSAAVALVGPVAFLSSRGMDHHPLMTGSSVLNKLANKVVRQLSGLGKLPDRAASELPAVAQRSVDVCVIGGGPAGLAAATATARA